MKIIKRIKIPKYIDDEFIKIVMTLNIDTNELLITLYHHFMENEMTSKFNSASMSIKNNFDDYNDVFKSKYIDDLYSEIFKNFNGHKEKKEKDILALKKLINRYNNIHLPDDINHLYRKDKINVLLNKSSL